MGGARSGTAHRLVGKRRGPAGTVRGATPPRALTCSAGRRGTAPRALASDTILACRAPAPCAGVNSSSGERGKGSSGPLGESCSAPPPDHERWFCFWDPAHGRQRGWGQLWIWAWGAPHSRPPRRHRTQLCPCGCRSAGRTRWAGPALVRCSCGAWQAPGRPVEGAAGPACCGGPGTRRALPGACRPLPPRLCCPSPHQTAGTPALRTGCGA